MSVNDLSIVIDPGGIPGVRAGINLRVFPDGESVGEFGSIGTDAERLASSSLSSGGFDDVYEFNFSFLLDNEDFSKFYSLLLYNKNARKEGKSWEVVLYLLTEPFREISFSRTRFKVPSTSILEQVDIGNGLTRWVYFVALQGALSAEFTRVGNKYKVDAFFKEGTFLSSSMES